MSVLNWSPTTLALVDDDHDRTNASDGVSRYGAYVQKNLDRFRGFDGEPLTVVEFTASAWQVATSPIMSPGYVRIRPDLTSITASVSEDREHLVVTINAPIRHDALATEQPRGLRDWCRDPYDTPGADGYHSLVEPEDHFPALLVSVAVRQVFSGGQLYSPANPLFGNRLVQEAQHAVRVLAGALNSYPMKGLASSVPALTVLR